MELTLMRMNERHEHFWQEMQKKFNETISAKPAVLREALDDLRADSCRYPVYWQRPLEQVVMDVEAKRELHQPEFSRRGGEAKKSDELSKLIDGIVERRPTISCHELLATLQRREKTPPIMEIDLDNNEIYLSDRKSVPVSGLKDRLLRAKKKLKSR